MATLKRDLRSCDENSSVRTNDKGDTIVCLTVKEATKALRNKAAVGEWMSSMNGVVHDRSLGTSAVDPQARPSEVMITDTQYARLPEALREIVDNDQERAAIISPPCPDFWPLSLEVKSAFRTIGQTADASPEATAGVERSTLLYSQMLRRTIWRLSDRSRKQVKRSTSLLSVRVWE